MQIIQHGTPPEPKVPWPFDGSEFTCGVCHCVFSVTRSDYPGAISTITQPRLPSGRAVMICTCPECGDHGTYANRPVLPNAVDRSLWADVRGGNRFNLG